MGILQVGSSCHSGFTHAEDHEVVYHESNIQVIYETADHQAFYYCFRRILTAANSLENSGFSWSGR